MPEHSVVVLPLPDGGAWLLQEGGAHVLTASRAGGPDLGLPVPLGRADWSWDACVDSDGVPWVTFSETGDDGRHTVYLRRGDGDGWGPKLQVSTDTAVWPMIRPDEYGNVWLFYSQRGAVSVCRMGARSGQEMTAARFEKAGLPLDAGSRGGALWVVVAAEDAFWIVRGTEHERFGEPVRLPSP